MPAQQPRVRDVLHERVMKRDTGPAVLHRSRNPRRASSSSTDAPRVARRIEALDEAASSRPHPPPDDGRGLQQRRGRPREEVDPRREQPLDRGRHSRRGSHARRELPAAVRRLERSPLSTGAPATGSSTKKGLPAVRVGDVAREHRPGPARPGVAATSASTASGASRSSATLRTAAQSAAEAIRAISAPPSGRAIEVERERRVAQRPRQLAGERERRGVGPVDVLDRDTVAPLGRDRPEPRRERVVQAACRKPRARVCHRVVSAELRRRSLRRRSSLREAAGNRHPSGRAVASAELAYGQ